MDGMLYEHGPLLVNEDGTKLTDNPWSWNKISNMIYLGKLLLFPINGKRGHFEVNLMKIEVNLIKVNKNFRKTQCFH